MKKNKILLFIPMYNCEKQIPRVLAQLTDEVLGYLSEVILVNNRSTDKTEDAARGFLTAHPFSIPVKILRNEENYGLGGSHKVAFSYAIENDFDYVIVLHGDDQGDIRNLLPYLHSGEYARYDCFLGARFMKDSVLAGYSRFRTFGNRVYNLLFSLGCGQRIYDLGSGLNVYKTAILQDGFYQKFADNLVFGYCMILASAYYKHTIRFFPIVWREEDQVSNVKMVSQAIDVLVRLCLYVVNKNGFIRAEHRARPFEAYHAQVVFERESKAALV